MNWNDAPTDERISESLGAIEDPADRLVESAKVANDARRDVFALRDERNLALGVLHLQRNWTKASCYRLVDIERGNFDKALDRIPATVLVDPEEVNWGEIEQNALDVLYLELRPKTDDEIAEFAMDANRRYIAAYSRWKAATLVRDAVATKLMTGKKRWTNAAIARATGLTTAAVSQIRRGERNPGKRAA
jgi:hypothetical protein